MKDSHALSDIEKEKIVAFVGDEIMFEAVRKVLLAGIYKNGVLVPDEKADATKNWALSLALQPASAASNEAVGADIRAMAQGISFLEKGFYELEKLTPRPVKSPIQPENPAL